MSIQRRISKIVKTPTPEPGFMGAGHEAVMVVNPAEYAHNDPFIALMDDRVDRPEGPLGGAHPHAGFETVTLMIEGSIKDRDEGPLHAGDALWMTAGSGVIHNEEVVAIGKVRLLQLWLTLPRKERWAEPRFERVVGEDAPVRRGPGSEVRLYSGAMGDLRSPTKNHVPVTLAEVRLERGAHTELELPTAYNVFVYVVEGTARLGADGAPLRQGQVGWLDRPHAEGESVLKAVAGHDGARLLVYAGLPTGDQIVVQGPFVGDTKQDITRVYQEYLAGGFPRMSELAQPAQA
ncbi:MAG: pirin family protein [Gemmatimonadetes bacterium]|nr:pirin family protein [Gemmatimonadota bacterium]